MDESFLPYAMLEPLLEPGMTAIQLGRKIFALIGLSEETHRLLTAKRTAPGTPFREAVKGGVVIVRRGSPEHLASRGCANHPVR